MGLSKVFRKFRGSIRLYLKQEVETRTNYETKMIFTFEKLAKAYAKSILFSLLTE